MDIRQYLYVSSESNPMSESALRQLLIEARDANAQHDISGLLLYVNGNFIQCVEGAADDIGQLIANIQNDSRNENFTMITDREVKVRTFPKWSMGFVTFSPAEFQDEPGFQGIRFPSDIDQIAHNNELIFAVMKNLYQRGFDAGLALP